jgi:crotonobetainyl-CoA:carnitine CoA-transferase CaiB-like acyl-CoA transferase
MWPPERIRCPSTYRGKQPVWLATNKGVSTLSASLSPLNGITVVNTSRRLAGAVASQLLAGHGARVIRVEDPPPAGGGESPARGIPNGWDDAGDLFAHFGRGSESVLLDLSRPDGVAALQQLVANAQVVIEDEHSSDDRGVRAALRAARDSGASFSLASITPFGLSGPWMDLPSSDLVVFAMSGLMANIAEPLSAPAALPGWLVQGHVGLAVFTAIASSIPIDGGPVGPHDLDIAELEVIANSNPHAIGDYSYRGALGGRQGNRMLPGYPWTVIPCKDGYVGVIVPQTKWDIFCLWMERPDMIDDPRFVDRYARSQHPDELDEIMYAWAGGLTKEELYLDGQARGLPFGGVFTVADSFDSAQLAERDFFDLSAKDSGSNTKFAGLPYVINGVRPTLGPAPGLGEQTEAILAESPDPVHGPTASQTALPLAGIRVLELTTAWAGPFSGRLLADLGAEVIKIESRRRMDVRGPAAPQPGQGSYPDGDPGESPWNRSTRFHERNRNKLSVTLELTDPRAKDAFLRLAAVSDVVLENFSPRVLPQLGLSFEELTQVQPGLIMMSLSGFGHTGPEQGNVAYGPTVEQVSGLASILGADDELPAGTGLFLPDVLGGTVGAGLVMAALRGRAADGQGRYIDVAEIEVVRWMMGHLVLNAQADGEAATARRGNRHLEFVPHGAFACTEGDRWVAIAIRSDAEWAALALEMGQPGLVEQFATQEIRARSIDKIEGIVGDWTGALPQAEVVARLTGASVPAAPVATIDQVFENEQLRSRDVFSSHPVAGSRAREISGGLWTMDGQRPGLRSPAPDLGEHNQYVLSELAGLSDEEIDELSKALVVGTVPAELDPV